MTGNELLTKSDLERFKLELLDEIRALVEGKITPPHEELIRSAEVRKKLGVSAGTLQHLRDNRVLSFTKIGGIIFYRQSEIADLLNKNFIEAK